MAIRTRRVLGFAVFLSAIVFGMHVAGQTPPPPGAAPPAGGLPAGVPPDAAAAAAAAGATGGAGGLPDMSSFQKMIPAGATGGGDAGNIMQKDKLPAFGPAAIQISDDAVGGANPMKYKQEAPVGQKETKPEKFVPSVVEVYSPKKVNLADPRAVLHTSMGDITIHLYPSYTPKTVHNFIDLARGDREFLDSKTGKPTRRPFYTDLTFHRVVDGFLIQTGCPFGTGHGGPGFSIPDEITPALRFHKAGMVAMAPERKDLTLEKRDSNGSQFFISLAAMPEWDDKFTIFGEVEKGMHIVQKIAKSQTGPTDRPIKRIYLNSIEIFEDTSTPKPDALGQ